MDDTKKTLLSIDIDTTALTQNVTNAKALVKTLTDQLTDLQTAGKNDTQMFKDLSAQLKTTTTDLTNTTKALQDYTKALGQKTKAQQADAKLGTKSTVSNTPVASAATNPSISNKSANNTSAPASGQANNSSGANTSDDKTDTKTVAPLDTSNATLNVPTDNTHLQNTVIVPPSKNFFKNILSDLKGYYDAAEKFDQDHLTANLKIASQRDQSFLDSATVVGDWLNKTNDTNKTALIARKAFAIAEIAINTEQAISGYVTATAKAVQTDSGTPFIGPALVAADIAAGAIEVAGAITNGVKQAQTLSSLSIPNPPATSSTTSSTTTTKGKARGGIFISDGNGAYLTGPGTGTSDSINAMLSNGESVINARSTQMFGPILSAINQAGGGIPFTNIGSGAYAQGGLFNGSTTFNDSSSDLANTRALNDMAKTLAANLPRQVLVVEDVQASLQNKVMLQNMSNF
jgi:hypothetical protein